MRLAGNCCSAAANSPQLALSGLLCGEFNPSIKTTNTLD